MRFIKNLSLRSVLHVLSRLKMEIAEFFVRKLHIQRGQKLWSATMSFSLFNHSAGSSSEVRYLLLRIIVGQSKASLKAINS